MAETRTTYTYSADGALLTRLQQWNSAPSASATPGSAINPASLDKSLRTDYVENKVYENGTLKRIFVDNGYIENGTYHFYVKDYLGNNRVVDRNSNLIQSSISCAVRHPGWRLFRPRYRYGSTALALGQSLTCLQHYTDIVYHTIDYRACLKV
ncbi:MAG: hypothetical protein LIP08_08315 [Bacteroides sp.]|nr:hypothetical protein [Bacteroides sp.]